MKQPLAHVNLARGYRGGERQTELLIRGLSEQGWRQRLVARAREPLASRCAGLPDLEIVETGGDLLAAARALRGTCLAHVHQGRSLKAAWLAHVFSGIPYVVTRRQQKGPRHNWLNRRMYRAAAAVAAISTPVQQALQELLPGLRCALVPDCSSDLEADANRARKIREGLGGSFVVGHVGALVDSHKGQRQIIEVARRSQAAGDGIAFVMVGSGPDEASLSAVSKDLSNIFFTGHVDNVGDYLAAFDVFMFPSRHEGLGSVLLDAMTFGLPIVATRVGGIPDIVEDGRNGLLVAPDDIDALYESVRRLQRDSTFYERMSRENIEKARGYAPAQMVAQYLGLYERVLGPAAATEELG